MEQEMRVSRDRIREEGIALLEEFSKELERVPETEETHYVMDVSNVVRDDRDGIRKKEFASKFQRIVPRWEDGFVLCEKGV
jgi:aspartyl-tRNA(Asn)/glutamyl-tRNA(Gln) amidotransferase subunit C